MSTLAVFLALAGGAIAATQLGRNSVKSRHIAPNAVKGIDAAERTFAEVPSAQRADSARTANTAASASTATLAGTAAIANAVASNSVGAAGIQDPVRSLSLPLASFLNETDRTLLSFTLNDGGAPEFETIGAIEYDDDTDGGGANLGDRDDIQSVFSVPADYASGGSFALRVEKQGHSGVHEMLEANIFIDGVSPSFFADSEATTAAAPTTYILNPPGTSTLQPGQAVALSLRVTDPGLNEHFDNVVLIRAVEFRYTATQ
jgi:hypothetical protein